MKITLWQQFSSNHSASFTVVGTFESADQAESVAASLRQMMREIATFWQGLSDEARQQWQADDSDEYAGQLTPVEQKWSDYFVVEWPKRGDDGYYRIDWLPPDPDLAEAGVLLVDRSVLVSDVWVTSSPHTHIVAILEQYGASIAKTSETENLGLVVTVTCTAPDESTAMQLMGDVTEAHGRFRVAGEYPAYYKGSRIPIRAGLKLTYPLHLIRGFSAAHSPLGAFVHYLEAHHCIDIHVEFSTVPA